MEEMNDFLRMSDTDRLKELVYLLENGIDGDIDYFICLIKEELNSRQERLVKPDPNPENVAKRVLGIIQDNYDPDATLQSVLGSDIYIDSLDIVELTMLLEKEFEILIYDEDVCSFNRPTKVQKIVDYINKRTEDK